MATGEIIAYWLCPAEPFRGQFAALIKDLAGRFDAPVFEPHVTIYVTRAGHDDAAVVLEKVLKDCGPFRLAVDRLDYAEKFTQTFFVQFAPNGALTRLSEDFRRVSSSPGDYRLNPHLSLIYKEMDAETKEQLAASTTLAFEAASFDNVKSIISAAEIKSREEVEAWRVIAEYKLTA